jgi:hypothetical protein
MGNFASTALVSSAAASDYAMDKQQASLWSLPAAWLATAVASVKTAVVAPAKTTAPAVDDCDLLAMGRPDLWELCASVVKDDDCESCMTDATDALTDSESERDSESEDEVDDDFFDAVGDIACVVDTLPINEEEHCNTMNSTVVEKVITSDCHCNPLVERLHRLVAAPSSSTARVLLFLDDYLCPCGDCPNAKRIACDVEVSSLWTSKQHKLSLTRLLQAFATYNEVIGYDCKMLEAASECLRMWEGSEDHAFTSFVMLFE